MSRVVYDLTIFEADGVTPWFGSADEYGEIVESDFQTPDGVLAHDRPYLQVPEGFSPSEVDFVNGSSRIGAGAVAVMDKRLTASDQTTGIVTSRIKDARGCRAVLRRYVDGAWRTQFDGVVHSYTVDSSELLIYWFHLRDGREFERDRRLFFSNHVLFGADSGSGPFIDYGQTRLYKLTGGALGRTMLRAVEPYESIVAGGISHFERVSDYDPANGIHFGVAPGPFDPAGVDFNVGELGYPNQDSDGIFRYREFQIAWRAKGSSDPWITLRNMPRAEYAHAVLTANGFIVSPGAYPAVGAPTLYFGSTDGDEVPETGQEIEFKVLAVNITEDTPLWWDGGTLGDLLQEIVNGDHTDEPPRERYDQAALAAFALASRPARMKLTKPVTDRRKWVEENIYKPAFRAPAFNADQELYAAAWRIPTAAELVGAPVIDADTIQPIGEWEHGTDNAVAEIEFTYIEEHLDPQTFVQKEKAKHLGLNFLGTKMVEVLDDSRADWQRLVETPITVPTVDPDAAPGAQKLVYNPVTIRSIAGVDGAPDGGDLQDKLGNEIVEEANGTVLFRLRDGAPRYQVDVTATLANLDLYQGQWVLVRFPPLPEYATGRRGLSHWMQIYAIADPSPNLRRLYLVDGRVPDFTADPDVVNPDEEDCLTGGIAEIAPSGRAARVFIENGNIVNGCAHSVTVQALLIAGGGGGGNSGSVGGGGGAGGVLDVVSVLIAAGQVIPVTIGLGGAPAAEGGDSVIWVDGAGMPLDPLTDPPPAATRAIGGGEGGGASGTIGGSGGGGGGTLPISGGGSQPGAAGTPPQGDSGGNGNDTGGVATCQSAAGGGGGSYGGVGEPGIAVSPGASGGQGGPPAPLAAWGINAGGGGSGGSAQSPGASGAEICGPELSSAGSPGSGYGAGGGGKGVVGAATAGLPGVVVIQYVGAAPVLPPPVITDTETTDENQVRICIEAADWPIIALDGYRVRVEYAVGDIEPAADSGDWRLAGYLEAPGCVTSVAVPTGATVWTRATAEAGEFLPSEPGAADYPSATPQTPGLLELDVTVDSAGVATVTWTPNDFCGAVVIRGLIHDAGDDTSRPLPLLDTLDASLGTYVIPGSVEEGQYVSVDVEAWGSLDPPAGGTLLIDTFTRGDSTTLGGAWTEPLGDFTITSNRLRRVGGAGTSPSYARNDAAAVGESFLQALVDASVSAGGRSELISRFAYSGGLLDGFILSPDPAGFWRLRSAIAGVRADLDTGAYTFSTGVQMPAQLYVADGVQEAWGDGVSLNAASTSQDGQNARAVAAGFIRSSGTATQTWDDWLWFSSKYLTVLNLPTGYKAKILDDYDDVVAEATEVSGTALVDCSMYGGCTEIVPVAGWAALIITNAADVEQRRYELAIYPGMDVDYEPVGEGRIYRDSVLFPVRVLALATDIIDPTHGGTGLTAYVLGDTIYASAANTLAVLPGNITTTRKFLRQTGTGAISAAPAWDTVTKTDVGLANVENTALSTWAGSAAITTIGTLVSGAVPASLVTAGTFGAGNFVFPTDLTVTNDLYVLGSDVVIGSAANVSIQNSTPHLHIVGTSAALARAAQSLWANNTSGPQWVFGKSRGNAPGVDFDIVLDADNIGVLSYAASDGVDAVTVAAQLRVSVDGTPAANRIPSRFEWFTNNGLADNNLVERMRLTAIGDLALIATAKLRLDGVLATGDTYITESSANVLDFVVGGTTPLLRLSSTAAIIPTGTLVAGHTSSGTIGGAIPRFQVHGLDAAGSRQAMVRWQNNNSGGQYVMGKSRGTTVGSFTTVQSGDIIGAFVAVAADGTDMATAAGSMTIMVDGTVATSRVPGRFSWSTANGLSDDELTERMRLTALGDLALITTAKLYLDGVAATGDTYLVESSANVLDAYAGGVNTLRLSATAAIVTGTLTASGAFGCNTKAAQTAYASGGALNAYAAGANGFDSGANASALHALVVNMRAALVANGIMS